MQNNLGAIKTARKNGDEAFCKADGSSFSTILDYWRWAHSELVGNAERGALAEYIVACALGIQDGTRIAWDSFDLQTKEGISVEIKTSGYIQTWGQKNLSELSFGIAPTHAWNVETNEFAQECKRQAQVYVFCVHNYQHKDEGLNPLDTRQWDFYVLATKVLNEKVPKQKNIRLKQLLKLGAVKSSFEELYDTIRTQNEKTYKESKE